MQMLIECPIKVWVMEGGAIGFFGDRYHNVGQLVVKT